MTDRKSTLKLSLALIYALSFFGCGGGSHSMLPANSGGPHGSSANIPASVTAAIFTPPLAGQSAIWNFQDGYNHRMWITVTAVPCAFGICDSNIVDWHFQKDSCESYWNPGTPAQCAVAAAIPELWFILHRDDDGAWRCIGFTYTDYLGVKRKVQILKPFGAAPPYTIIPTNSAISDPPTSYNAVVQILPATANMEDFSIPSMTSSYSATWQTTTGTEQIKDGASAIVAATISDQTEGCVHEHWDYVASATQPLVLIRPIVGLGDNGACVSVDPLLTMHAIVPMSPRFIGPFERP